MTDRAKLIASVQSDEGYRASPYKDSLGLYTIGIGRCLETNPFNASEWRELLANGWLAAALTREGAQWLVDRELTMIESALAHDYGVFWGDLNDARANALIEMAYQMGVVKEEAFHQMVAALERSDYAGAAAAGLASLWARQTPARAKKLMDQLRTGVFTA